MDRLTEILEAEMDVSDQIEDVQYSSGVLSLVLGDGKTFVLNKQAPNKQLWLSSPFSGPQRYEKYSDGQWVNVRSGLTLTEVLTQELIENYSVTLEI